MSTQDCKEVKPCLHHLEGLYKFLELEWLNPPIVGMV